MIACDEESHRSESVIVVKSRRLAVAIQASAPYSSLTTRKYRVSSIQAEQKAGWKMGVSSKKYLRQLEELQRHANWVDRFLATISDQKVAEIVADLSSSAPHPDGRFVELGGNRCNKWFIVKSPR